MSVHNFITFRLHLLRKIPAPPARYNPNRKLTHRRPIGGSPLRGSAFALSIRTYHPLTRAP